MTDSLAIETSSLTRSFGPCIAVDGIDLRVSRANVYGFLGPNGAGKTTTIRLLLGLLRPDSGSILLDGEILTRDRRDIMRRIGALVETPALYPHLTGRENLEITRRILDVPESRLSSALDVFGLTKDADRLVRAYSLGMRQRLGLALAWVGEPRLLMLDEPANGLDPAGIRDLRNQIRQFAHDKNVTVFLSSHVLGEVEQIADQIGIINHGRLLFQGRLQELQRYQPPLTVMTDRNPEAAALLKSNGWQVRGNSADSIAVRITSDADIAAINRSLLDHGIQVYRLERTQETLEEFFLRLVSGAPQHAVAQ
jgi:lantibiotic transport system ATP-binding protein